MVFMLIRIIIFIVFAPFIGGLIHGVDRKLTAWMQGRVGPPILQPFYDVAKLFQKQTTVVRSSQNIFIYFYLIFIVFTGCLFFNGDDILLFVFSLMLANIFLILGAYKATSPYSIIGAQRELLQKVAVEPMILLTVMAFYLITKSFYISKIIQFPHLLFWYLPGVFFGFLFILTIKIRKSPFDFSTSHHGHQEIVKGITTEFSGEALALIEIAHWYEILYVLGLVYLFFAASPLLGIGVVIVSYFLEILIDNTCARVKWPHMLKSAWGVSMVLGVGNIVILYLAPLFLAFLLFMTKLR